MIYKVSGEEDERPRVLSQPENAMASLAPATDSVSGYLTKEDWSAFNTGVLAKLKCRGYRNAAQSITNAQKVNIDVESYDPDSILDIANSKVVPTRAGYYMCSGHLQFASATNIVGIAIYKSGGLCTYGSYTYRANTGITMVVANDMVYCNGTTDYIELYGFAGSATALTVGTSAANFLTVFGPF